LRLTKLSKTAVTALDDIKARDIVVIDVRKRVSLYDTIIIATADSHRQVSALARHLCDRVKEGGGTVLGVEGGGASDWVLVDCGDMVVHIMQPAARAYYNLEELWSAARPARAAKSADRAAA